VGAESSPQRRVVVEWGRECTGSVSLSNDWGLGSGASLENKLGASQNISDETYRPTIS